MSLILDALKKSDNERKSKAAPSISDVRNAQPETRTPRWVIWFVGLLAVNLLVLLVVLTRGSDKPEAVVEEVPLPIADSSPQPVRAALTPPTRKEAVRSLANEAAGTAPKASAPVPEQPAATPAPQRTASATARSERETAAMAAFNESDNRDLPSFSRLKADGVISLPQLHIDLHVYDANPSRRLVFVNGVKYTEGDTLSDGPSVDNIRKDGVALRYQGVEFLLERD